MRPIRLEMSAFGSYGGKELVDFEKIKQGLFLVTGDTGAGKTTIFDGIMYALYDQTSGGKREGAMMRSQYADSEIPTYVALEFQYAGLRYRICRNPEYYRQSKRRRKDGTYPLVKTAASVELYLPDGSVYPGKKRDVDKKIVEIIGLDADQFRQVVMIAQGDFLRLLHAGSKERKEIFSKIFRTRIYWWIQESLKNKAKSYYVELENLNQMCRREINTVQPVEESAYKEPWEDIKEQAQFRLKEVVEILENIVSENKDKLAKAKENKVQAKDELEQWEELLRRQIASEKALRALQNNAAALKELEEWIKTHKELLETRKKRMEEAKEALANREPELTEEMTRFSDGVKKYETLKNCQKKKKELECTIQVEEVLARKVELEELKASFALFIKVKKEEVNRNHKVQDSQQVVREKNQLYNDLYEQFFHEQAGILANDLAAGMPCPVCGSCDHPRKAVLSAEAPTQKQVEEAKKSMEQAVTLRDQDMLSFQESKRNAQLHEEQTTMLGRKILASDTFHADEAGRKYLIQVMQELGMQEEACLAAYKSTMGSLYRGKKLTSAEAWQAQIQKEQLQLAALHKEAELLAKELPHDQESHTRKLLEDCTKELNRLRTISQSTARDYEQISNQWNVKAGEKLGQESNEKILKKEYDKEVRSYQSLAKELNVPEDRGLFNQKKKELADTIGKMEKEYLEAYTAYGKNKDALSKLGEYAGRQEGLQKEYLLYQDLSRTANGQLTGSVKLDFETYVQRQYFQQIVSLANRRLLFMNNGQFMLQCRNVEDLGTQGQVGLDLDVYHLVNNSTRDVKTLSGGESFMAALAMALGLADMIQNQAGAIRLDTMFVDEGFGSLDDEARGQAIQVLLELSSSDRLVGIISHVNELKEQIDEKLVITKDEKGSHVNFFTEI